MFLKIKLIILMGILSASFTFVGCSQEQIQYSESSITNSNVSDNANVKLFNSPKETFQKIIAGPKGTFSKFLMIIVYGLLIAIIINLPVLIKSMSLNCSEKAQMGIAGSGMIYGVFFLIFAAFILLFGFHMRFWFGTLFLAAFLSLYTGNMFKRDSR